MCGLQTNWEGLSLLLSQYDPTAACIQETLLHSNKTASFKNYSYYGIPALENNGSLRGGVAILVKNTTPHQHLHIITLQATALRLTALQLHISFSFYSIQYHQTETRRSHSSTSSPFCFWGILMLRVSYGAPQNAVLEGRWWKTLLKSNLSSQ